jgi:ferredoxin
MPQFVPPARTHPAKAPMSTFQVTLQPGPTQFAALSTDTVLSAALQAGIELPSACRNGTCRVCISQLLQGQIAYQIEWPGVSADEKCEGYFLPCVAHACSDLTMQSAAAV